MKSEVITRACAGIHLVYLYSSKNECIISKNSKNWVRVWMNETSLHVCIYWRFSVWMHTLYECTVIPLFLLYYLDNFIQNFSTNYKVIYKIKKTCRKHPTSSSREHIDKSILSCFLLQDMRFSYCNQRHKLEFWDW